MKFITRFLWIFMLMGILCIILFLSVWGIPTPSVEIEKVLTNEEFIKEM